MKISQLRIGDTWIWEGHRRYIATTPFPVGGGQYTFDTHLGGKGGPVEHHRESGHTQIQVEAAR